MIRSDFIDYLLLNDTLNVGDYSGRVTSLSVRGLIIRENIPDVSDGELLDSIKRLYDRGTLALEKYDDAIRSYKPYAQYTNDAVFFMRVSSAHEQHRKVGGRLIC